MVSLAFIGTIQHDIARDAMRRLVDTIKADAQADCIVVCNANGLFSTASKLDEQLGILFDCGIDLVTVGEQAISRSTCRSVFAKAEWPVIKAANLAGSTTGTSIKTISHSGCTLHFVCTMDGTGKVPSGYPHEILEEFFKNKKDKFPVVINENGNDFRYLKALAWKYSDRDYPVMVFGSGTGVQTGISKQFTQNCLLQCDVGSVATENTIYGIDPQQWWTKAIDRRPITLLPKWGSLLCDYTIVWLNSEKIEKFSVKSVRI